MNKYNVTFYRIFMCVSASFVVRNSNVLNAFIKIDLQKK